jgi:hypothetical protein
MPCRRYVQWVRHGSCVCDVIVMCGLLCCFVFCVQGPMGQSKDQYAADTRLQKLREMPLIRNANNVVHSCENGLLVDIVRAHCDGSCEVSCF